MPIRIHKNLLDEFEGPLVRRLRALSWPQPTPEVRRRCLEQIQTRLSRDQADDAPAPERPRRAGLGHISTHFTARSFQARRLAA